MRTIAIVTRKNITTDTGIDIMQNVIIITVIKSHIMASVTIIMDIENDIELQR